MRWVAFSVAIGLCATLLAYVRNAQIAAAPMLPVSFAHIDHKEVNCVDCHHNFVDTTGSTSCFSCHKDSPAIASSIEAMFHELCRDCHVDRQRDDLAAGPTRDCQGCHEGDQLP